jgi:type I restriction enzyme S subunit
MPLVVPPDTEQQEIAAFCDEKSAEIGQLINDAERAVSLLTERRSTLISAAVTGQIDVRTYRPAEELVPA